MRKLFQILIVFFSVSLCNAQELNCLLSINSDNIQGTNKQVYTTLENALKEFMNQTKFTFYNYKTQERINCSMTITILEQNGDNFVGNIQVQSSRPVYNSTYLSPVFNFKDVNFGFKYQEFEPLLYNQSEYQSNLVSIMTYYAYIILGMDADTFSFGGGMPFFAKAQDVAVQAQQSGYTGWNQSDGPRTRFMLIDNIMSPAYSLFHNALYKYHLQGMDLMISDPKLAKENIAKAVNSLKTLYDARPASFVLRVFFDAKSDEIVDIFSDGPNFDTFKLKEDLLKMSPLNAEKWNVIK
ncbi:DUF4835 family protein [Lutibacter sp. HS1-25]|uniref:type IX secretion system protein PorD n=1 Tax=Lutibacter sp. HS1-25 TaxID=2485000 RepID=UPI0010116198|nr:DUF4835 family protein [Lutibacter sp. HS1-25]RXP52285.1 DUF4835 family protein [Lutibacter sp. HS1-25]